MEDAVLLAKMLDKSATLVLVGLVVLLAATPLAADEGEPARPLLPAGTDPGSVLPQDGEVRRLTLEQAVAMGLRANLSLLAASYDPLMATEGWRAASAVFDPLVGAALDYSHDETPATSAFFGRDVVQDNAIRGEVGVERQLRKGGRVALLYRADRLDTNSDFITLNPAFGHGLTLEGAQPLMRGAGEVAMADIRRSRNGIEIAEAQQRTVVQEVLLQIVTVYWELVYAQELVVARQKSEDVAAKLLVNAEARLGAKVGTPLDVAEAKAGLERRVGDRIGAEGQRGAMQDILRTLIMPFDAESDHGLNFIAISEEEPQQGLIPDVKEIDRYVRLALANRPELRASEADLWNRSIDVYVAANALRPQLDVVGRIGTAGLEDGLGRGFGKMVTGQAISYGAGIQFSLFVGQRAAKANLRLAEWARRQATVNMKELENQIVAEIRAALRDVLVAKAREKAATEEVTAASENLRGEQALLDNGKSTPFDVLLREDTLTEARRRVARATADRRVAEARLWKSVGFLAQTLGVGGQGSLVCD